MDEAAARLNLSRSTLYYRAKTGQVPVVRVNNHPRIPASWVANKLAADIAAMQARAEGLDEVAG